MTPKSVPPTATWYFDVVSPFSYLALGAIEEMAKTMTIVYRPILFAGLLQHWNQLGPAEIAPKRIHTYRFCVFEAQRRGIPFRFPPAHPFNPLKLLRLITALKAEPRVVRAVMDCVWRDGLDLSLEADWAATCSAVGLDPARANALVEAPDTKAALRANTEEAIAAKLFGVPTLRIGDESFWGLDTLPMARAYLDNPEMLNSGEMLRVATMDASSSRVPIQKG
jgi:2-hydroxychromene-2-carboxylate isomerase